ncbi:MAG TPA: HAD family hydrolase [Longimicrobiales bacterium]
MPELELPATAQPPRLRPAAFLDRDGTIMVERGFLADPAGVELLPGALEGLRALREAGYALVIVTNQSGIARGYFGEPEFRAVQARLEELLAGEGISLDGVYLCPHHPDSGPACNCRKPAPGLYRRAAEELRLDLSRSLFIGDRPSDVQAARTLGGTGILLRTGYGDAVAAALPTDSPLLVLGSLADVGSWLEGAGQARSRG